MAAAAGQYLCPHCTLPAEIDDPQPQQIVVCPHCGEEFILPWFAALPGEDAAAIEIAGDKLDSARIQQFAAVRRATYRSRSYALIAAAGCSAAVAQLGVMTVRDVLWNGWSLWPIGYIALAVAAALGAWHFIGQAIKLNQSIIQISATKSSTHAPDFGPLGDGSQRENNLEQIR